jgi:hypothetical protein
VGSLQLTVTCTSCGRSVWVAAFYCPDCGAPQHEVPRRPTVGTWSAEGQPISLTVHGNLRMVAAFGALLTFDEAQTAPHHGAISPISNRYHALYDPPAFQGNSLPWLAELITHGQGRPIEYLTVGRWLVIRTERHLHILPGALLGQAAAQVLSHSCQRPSDVSDLLRDVALKPTAPRLGSIGRLTSTDGLSHWLVALTARHHAETVLTFFKIESASPETPWLPRVIEHTEYPLTGDGWWLDRGATVRGEVLLAGSPRQALLFRPSQTSHQKVKFVVLPLPAANAMLPAAAATLKDTGLLVLAHDARQTVRAWLLRIDEAPYPVLNVPQSLEGVEPVGSKGVRGRTPTTWHTFEWPPAFTLSLDSYPIAQVHAVLPGAVVYRSTAANQPLVRFAESEVVLAGLIENPPLLRVALDGPRLWTAMPQHNNQSWKVQAWRWGQ